MKLVIVESPFHYAHDHPRKRAVGILRNVTYARLALRDCLLRGEQPWCSHLVYTQPLVLDDSVPAEREIGIAHGLSWASRAEVTAAYVDLGLSSGMRRGIADAARAGRPCEERRLEGWAAAPVEEPRDTLVRLGLYTDAALDALARAADVFGPAPLDAGFAAAAAR